ncbi:MAG: sigma-70 family RNA polymerase sigma factor [Clostridia bacterium]|nr:sigma-70 family RNA polymerase sigma factor [Clostridia bacterium]
MNYNTIEKINKCIKEIREGNNAAITVLHEHMGSHLYFIAVRYLKNRMEAEDAVQDFWLDIHKYCSRCWYVANGFNYFTKIFENLVKMRLRKQKRNILPLNIDDIAEFEKSTEDLDLLVRQIALRDTFDRAIIQMTDDEKKVFMLVCYEEKTVRQIAKVLFISKSNVQRLRQRAIDIVKQVLIEDGWDKDED